MRAGKKILRIGVAVAAAWAGYVGCAQGAESSAAIVRHNLHIPRQTLDVALQDLAQQTHLQIVRFSDAIKGDTIVGPLHGEYSVDQALQALLAPSGLTYQVLNERAYMVIAPETREPAEVSEPSEATTSGAGTAPARVPTSEAIGLEEIIVTAQKVEERLRDIPMSITALTGRDLQAMGARQFIDFANTVPSLNYTSNGVGQTQVNLRGITSGYNVSPTVGIYVDDVPYGSSTPFADSARLALDVGLFDMSRIEILRGPQGTLYGASTMGGLLKYVSNVPDTAAFGGTVRANAFSIQHGGVGYDASSAVNIPLVADKSGLRVSGFYMRSGGYIDDLSRRDEDVDQADVHGGRLDLLLTPNERLSVRLVAFAQDIDRDGSIVTDVDRITRQPIDDQLEQRRIVKEPFDQRFRLASATVNHAFDFATLSSISSIQTIRSDSVTDFSRLYVPAFGGPSVFSAVGLARIADTDKFTQEIRLAASGPMFDWLVGGFYTQEDSDQSQQLLPYDPSGAPSPVDLFTARIPSEYEEYAGFANLTFHVTGKLDVAGGVRYAHNSHQQEQIASGVLIGPVPVRRSSDSVATYLANVRYRASENAMPYIRFATGYRPGGPNGVVNDLSGRRGADLTFDADKLTSYEAGIKLGSADRRVNAELAMYHIDWDDMQITAIRSGLGVIANAAQARSRGAELTVTALPLRNLSIVATFGYTDAELTENAPDLGGVKGESLPDAPQITAALSVDYRFALRDFDAFAGAAARYIADRNASFDQSIGMLQYELPDYMAVDLRTGVVFGGTRVQLYCKNVTDEWGQLSAMTGMSLYGASIDVSTLQPRTFGVSVDVSF